MTDESSLIRRALLGLLDAQDFLGYQLTHANGGMSDDQLNGIADEHFAKRALWTEEDIVAVTRELAGLIPDRLDALLVSVITGCDIELASRVLVAGAEAEVKERAQVRNTK
jgi:hypothetical protein